MMVGQLERVKSEMNYESKDTHNHYYAVYFSGLAVVLNNFPHVNKSDISCSQHRSSPRDHCQRETKNSEPTKIHHHVLNMFQNIYHGLKYRDSNESRCLGTYEMLSNTFPLFSKPRQMRST